MSMIYSHIIGSYQDWLREYDELGWDLWFVTFQFKHLGEKEVDGLKRMEDDIRRVYSTLLTRLIRKPHQKKSTELPALIGCPDRPVRKRKPTSCLAEIKPNAGLHYHCVIALPPKTRLEVPLDRHMRDHDAEYRGSPWLISRIDVRRVTDLTGDGLADYTFKHYKRGTFTGDHILVLPRTQSEMPVKLRSQSPARVAPHELRAAFYALLSKYRTRLLEGQSLRVYGSDDFTLPAARRRPLLEVNSRQSRDSRLTPTGATTSPAAPTWRAELFIARAGRGTTRSGVLKCVVRDLEAVFASLVVRDPQFQRTPSFARLAEKLAPLCTGDYWVQCVKPIDEMAPAQRPTLRNVSGPCENKEDKSGSRSREEVAKSP